MTENELKEIIFTELKKVAPECNPAGVKLDENIREALDIDSFSFLKLLVGIGDRTGVEIPEMDYAKVSTLTGMMGYLSPRLL